MRTGDGVGVGVGAVRSGAGSGSGSGTQRGFTYLWLLFALAAGAAGLAALGQQVSTAVQREREAELMFRGQQIAGALARYAAATPGPVKLLPLALQELVDDRRSATPAHHLRRLYTDPFTGRADWQLLLTADGRIQGLRSRASVVALRSVDLPTPPTGQRALVSDRVFRVSLPSPEAAASSATSTPRRRRGGPDDTSDLPGGQLPGASEPAVPAEGAEPTETAG